MRIRRRFQFRGKKHSHRGIVSSLLGGTALAIVIILTAAAYVESGQAGKGIAVAGFLALLLAAVGLGYGILGCGEEDSYQLFPRLGCCLNLLLLVGFAMIYMLGW